MLPGSVSIIPSLKCLEVSFIRSCQHKLLWPRRDMHLGLTVSWVDCNLPYNIMSPFLVQNVIMFLSFAVTVCFLLAFSLLAFLGERYSWLKVLLLVLEEGV